MSCFTGLPVDEAWWGHLEEAAGTGYRLLHGQRGCERDSEIEGNGGCGGAEELAAAEEDVHGLRRRR